ncbi:rhodanese-like domain-containing protein [Helicobacter cholecystus]|uniref:rhodanese-like domain-containing protein n=1 Tax=Helicobacter cholecystus TaxID=45498 RepID=UPI0027392733|nr:rhodanese-like domain-containing protein [Helicobacter cholecystus]
MKKTLFALFVSFLILGGCGEKKKDTGVSIDAVIEKLQVGEKPNAPQALIDDAEIMINRADIGHYSLITPKELKKLMDLNSAFSILSVSPKGEYLLGMIPKAKNFEISASNKNANGILQWDNQLGSQEQFAEKMGGDKRGVVVIYDSGSGSHYLSSSADTACLWAKKLGFEKVYLLVGGFKAWKEQGYPTTLQAPSCCE